MLDTDASIKWTKWLADVFIQAKLEAGVAFLGFWIFLFLIESFSTRIESQFSIYYETGTFLVWVVNAISLCIWLLGLGVSSWKK